LPAQASRCYASRIGKPATADRPLTVKQTKFAADIAAGEPKVKALRKHYRVNPPDAPANHKANDRNRAVDYASRPNVAAEIRRLTWLSCPPADDVRGMREHSIRVLSDLSRSAKQETVRLQSALALYRIAETTRAAAAPHTTTQEQDRMLSSLRQLYRSIQGVANDPPRMNAASITGDGVPDPLPNLPIVCDQDEPIDITLASEPAQDGQDAAAEPGEDTTLHPTPENES
jgi:hypothetical protein